MRRSRKDNRHQAKMKACDRQVNGCLRHCTLSATGCNHLVLVNKVDEIEDVKTYGLAEKASEMIERGQNATWLTDTGCVSSKIIYVDNTNVRILVINSHIDPLL